MPLPIRDLSFTHSSLIPALTDIHARYPLSKYAPTVAMFRLYKLSFERIPLMAQFYESTWMTLACLEDHSSDLCVMQAAVALSSGATRDAINNTFIHHAAPFLVPMFNPHMSHHQQSHVSETAVPTMTESSAASKLTHPRPRKPPPAVATKRVETLSKLHPSVLRVVASLVAEQKIDVDVFTHVGPLLSSLPVDTACKALRDYSKDTSRQLISVLTAYT